MVGVVGVEAVAMALGWAGKGGGVWGAGRGAWAGM